jgi:eukaryotic-like serine/threonine-protein kinase
MAPRIVMSLRDLVGTELDGRYLLRKVLGEGAMGVVFRATQLSVGRDVAVKLLKLEQFRSQDSYERFQREMSIIGGLKHPNVVSLLDSGRDERLGVFYIVMELVDGVSLGDLIYDPPRPAKVEFALEIIYQICGALTEPHRRGIIHRDIKPDNVLLVPMSDETLQVKVVDFGVARAADGQDRVTATGVVVGTPAYMAPELCQATPIGPATDLYAVGVMLFELITGAVPFEANSSMAVIIKHIQEQPPLLTAKLKGDFPYPEIVSLVQHLLAKRVADRPANALDVRERIDEIRERYQLRRVRVSGGASPRRAFEPWLLTSNPARQSQYRSAEVVPTTTLITTPGGADLPVEQVLTLERGFAPRPATITEDMHEASGRATPDRSATSVGFGGMTVPMSASLPDEDVLSAGRPAWMMPLALLCIVSVAIAGVFAVKLAAGDRGEVIAASKPAVQSGELVEAPPVVEVEAVEPVELKAVEPIEVKPAEPVEVKPAAPADPPTKRRDKGKPRSTKLEDPKPVEVKPVEVKPAEVKPAEVKPVEVKPVEKKPVEKPENKYLKTGENVLGD